MLLILMIAVICGTVYIRSIESSSIQLSESLEEKEEVLSTEKEETVTTESRAVQIKVYICGSVYNPGIVEITEGVRLGEALVLVGGALDTADLNSVNLAHRLSDAEMVYIPKKGEIIIDKQSSVPGFAIKNASSKSGKVNINTASKSELETLPGIGPSTADKIIAYRQKSGGFKNAKDLMNVTGIGEKKYEAMKDFITTQ